jgi:acyl carrier protein
MTIAIGDTTLATVIAIVNDLTQDWGLETSAPPSASTLLAADLQFASEECYERRFGFQDLLMRDGSYVGDLSLGQLSHFVDTQLTKEEPTA